MAASISNLQQAVSAPRRRSQLASALTATVSRFDQRYVPTDPLRFVLAYQNAGAGVRDLEVAAFYASALAYGGVKIIGRSLQHLFSIVGETPEGFVLSFDPRRDGPRFNGFGHRFHKGPDLALLTWLLRQTLERYGSLEALFLEGDRPHLPDIGPGLARFVGAMLQQDARPLLPQHRIPAKAPVRHFLPSPAGGSACKRLCLFLRWMVRRKPPDLGLWSSVDPARLVVPLDTHVARLGRYLGLTQRQSSGWQTAREVTAGLRRYDPRDPVRFDFSLAHLGIHHCRHQYREQVCQTCPLEKVCKVAREGKSAVG